MEGELFRSLPYISSLNHVPFFLLLEGAKEVRGLRAGLFSFFFQIILLLYFVN